MKVSIITAVLNNSDYVGDCIQSLLGQTYRNIEYILVDGGSTDGTLQIIKKYENEISKWISEPDNGLYDAMNKGIALATGEVIGLLNADDVYADNMVLKKIAGVFTDISIDGCYGDLVYVDKYNLNRIVRYWKSCAYQDGLFCNGWAPPHPTFFVRRKVYEKYGVFDLSYSMGNDVDLMMRFLSKYKMKAVYIPDILVKMRVGGVSNRNFLNIVRQNMELFRAGKKNDIKIFPPGFIFRKIIARISQYTSKQ
jgi:glycosyltransferase involved in cell wall biosynthesis